MRVFSHKPGSTTPLFILLLCVYGFHSVRSEAQTGDKGSLTLNGCIEIAIQNNPGFRSSWFQAEETKAKTDEAFSAYYPKVNIGTNADTYSRNSGEQRYNNFSSGVSVSYDIYRGSGTKSNYAASQANYQAALLRHETNKQDLVFNIIQTYYRTLQMERTLKSAEEAIRNTAFHLEFALARQKAGLTTRSDVLKSEVEVANAELKRIQVANALASVKGSLNYLMGFPSDTLIMIADDLSSEDLLPAGNFDSLLAQALMNRAELERFQALLNAQKEYINVAQSGYYPSLSANANYNYSGPEPAAMKNNWWLGMTLSVPVFSGFSNKARVSQEVSAYHGLGEEFEQLRQQISLEVWNAWLSVKESAERITASLKAAESAKENLLLAEGEYREGVGSIIQLTDAQTTFVIAEQNHIEALADYKISLAQLERTIGKN